MVVERCAVFLGAARSAVVAAGLGRILGMLRRLAECRDDVVHRQDARDGEPDEQGTNRPPALPHQGTKTPPSHEPRLACP